jgi:hypothetical protein
MRVNIFQQQFAISPKRKSLKTDFLAQKSGHGLDQKAVPGSLIRINPQVSCEGGLVKPL